MKNRSLGNLSMAGHAHGQSDVHTGSFACDPGQDQGVAYYVVKAIVTLAYPCPPPQMFTLCGSLLDIVIAIMKLFHSEARIQVSRWVDVGSQGLCVG